MGRTHSEQVIVCMMLSLLLENQGNSCLVVPAVIHWKYFRPRRIRRFSNSFVLSVEAELFWCSCLGTKFYIDKKEVRIESSDNITLTIFAILGAIEITLEHLLVGWCKYTLIVWIYCVSGLFNASDAITPLVAYKFSSSFQEHLLFFLILVIHDSPLDIGSFLSTLTRRHKTRSDTGIVRLRRVVLGCLDPCWDPVQQGLLLLGNILKSAELLREVTWLSSSLNTFLNLYVLQSIRL